MILRIDNAALPTLQHKVCNHGREPDGVPVEQNGSDRCQQRWQSIAIDMLVDGQMPTEGAPGRPGLAAGMSSTARIAPPGKRHTENTHRLHHVALHLKR